ncbi:accessory gene regulator B family protein [Catenibacterium mitsuokai]|uniref:accessory gene regulator B family protein n=1 Tax=Catenibacterium mitsuokai TaxID=100886 RepID=UPI0039B0B2CA
MNILSNVIVDLLGYNNPEEREIYKYGVQILLSDLSNFLIIIVPSLIFNKLSEGIVSYYRTRSYSSNNSSFLFYLEVISYH